MQESQQDTRGGVRRSLGEALAAFVDGLRRYFLTVSAVAVLVIAALVLLDQYVLHGAIGAAIGPLLKSLAPNFVAFVKERIWELSIPALVRIGWVARELYDAPKFEKTINDTREKANRDEEDRRAAQQVSTDEHKKSVGALQQRLYATVTHAETQLSAASENKNDCSAEVSAARAYLVTAIGLMDDLIASVRDYQHALGRTLPKTEINNSETDASNNEIVTKRPDDSVDADFEGQVRQQHKTKKAS